MRSAQRPQLRVEILGPLRPDACHPVDGRVDSPILVLVHPPGNWPSTRSTETTVAQHLEANGIVIGANTRKLSDQDLPAVVARYASGDSTATIAADHDVSASTIERELEAPATPCGHPEDEPPGT